MRRVPATRKLAVCNRHENPEPIGQRPWPIEGFAFSRLRDLEHGTGFGIQPDDTRPAERRARDLQGGKNAIG